MHDGPGSENAGRAQDNAPPANHVRETRYDNFPRQQNFRCPEARRQPQVMGNFFITQHSLGYIGPAILALSIAATIFLRMWRLWRCDRTRLLLGCYFLGAGLFNLLHFFGYSLYSPEVQTVWYIVALTPLATLFLMLFAYRFPRPFSGREPLTATFSGIACGLIAFAIYAHGAFSSPVIPFGRSWGSEYRSLLIPLFISAVFLWTVIILLRQTIHAEQNNVIKAVLHPVTPEGKLARAFALVVLCEAANSGMVAVATSLYPVRETLFTFGMNAVLMAIYTLYVLIYLAASYTGFPLSTNSQASR
jgi:hypothetical protein